MQYSSVRTFVSSIILISMLALRGTIAFSLSLLNNGLKCGKAGVPQRNPYSTSLITMRKGDNKGSEKYTKSNLPSKICDVCGRPFSWRKKWEKVWDEVKYCSDRCRSSKNSPRSGVSIQSTNPFTKHSSKTYWRGICSFAASAIINMDPTSITISSASAADVPSYPKREEVQKLSSTIDWKSITPKEFRKSDFNRLDESDDSRFYLTPRFVEHIDQNAVSKLTKFHENEIKRMIQQQQVQKIDVLDLCSSWVSHIPQNLPINNFIVLGMNREELDANPLKTDVIVQDLNKVTRIPLESQSFDLILLQLSIDYLVHPVEVLQEARRLLRPNGQIIISFSNRVFIDKAVALWSGKSDLDHIETVEEYLYLAGFPVEAINADSIVEGGGKDPLYVVVAKNIGE